MRLLISSAGRRVQLLRCFRESGQHLCVSLEIFATDWMPQLSAACALADRNASVSHCGSHKYIDQVLGFCRDNEIRLVVPTIDPELPIWARHRDDFEAEGIRVAVSTFEVVTIASDKAVTADALRAGGVSTPETMEAMDYVSDPDRLEWPVIIKPRRGSSSIGVLRPKSKRDAISACKSNSDVIVQALWEGREYTVNMFCDHSRRLLCAIPHLRIETRGGEVSKGRTEDVPVLRSAARRIAAALPGAEGPLCFQAIVTEGGEYAVFEINARFGGGYPLAHHAGATFTQWLLEETLGLPCTAHDNWRPGVTMLRFDDAVFLEP